MSNHMKFCGCRTCRRGRSRSYGKFVCRAANRKFRQQAKQALKKGDEPDRLISVPYTD